MSGTVRCSRCFNAIPAGTKVCPSCGLARHVPGSGAPGGGSGGSGGGSGGSGSSGSAGSRARRPGSGGAGWPSSPGGGSGQVVPRPAAQPHPLPSVPPDPSASAELQGRIEGDPTREVELRSRPALRAWHRALPLLMLGLILYLIYTMLSDPQATMGFMALLLVVFMPLILLLAIPAIMGMMIPGAGRVFSAVSKGAGQVAGGIAKAGRRAAPSPPPSARGGPLELDTLSFRLRDASGQEHVCIASSISGVPSLVRGDEVVVRGKPRRDGVLAVHDVRSARSGTVLVQTKMPFAWYGEYGARVAWVVALLYVIGLVLGSR